MRILVIVPSLPSAGGAEKVAWGLSKTLAINNEIHILTLGHEQSSKIIDNVCIHYLPIVRHVLRYYLTLGKIKVKRIEEEVNPDVIHAHMTSILAYILRKSKSKTVLTLHHSEIERYNLSPFQKFKYNLFDQKLAKDFDVVTTVSGHMQKYFEEYFKRKIVLIPNGVDINNFKPIKGIERDEKTILYVGRLVKSKGVEKIFELAKQMPDYKFILVGDGPLINLFSLPNVEFVGKKNSEELPFFYNKAKYSFFPSSIENFPLVGLEAMACGSIVIAQADGFREYIENGKDGFILPQSDIINIVDKLISLEIRKDLYKIRTNAIKKVKRYNWNVIAKKYLKVYQS